MADPKNLFPVSGIIYDIDETPEEGVTVKITNTRNGDIDSIITNSQGQYTLDLANLNNAYATNDIIFIQAWKEGNPFKLISSSFLVEGSNVELNLHLRPVFSKRMKTQDLKETQLEGYQNEFASERFMNPDAERSDFTRNSSGYVTKVVEYISGVKKTTTITRNSNNEVTKIEVS